MRVTAFVSYCVVAVASIAMATAADGAVIYSNPITGTNPNAANPYTAGDSFDPNITVSGIGRGTGAIGANANNRYNASSWDTAAIDLNAYFDWTLSPNTGYEIDFTSLLGEWQRSSTGPTSYVLRSSLDSYVGNIASGAITGSGVAVAYNLDLSAVAFDSITSPITFRLYAWGASASGGTFSINDFAFDGEVGEVVPEPASLALLTLAGLAVVVYVRRRS